MMPQMHNRLATLYWSYLVEHDLLVLLYVQVERHVLLLDPRHVVGAPDVQLRHGVLRVLVQHYGDGPGAAAAALVLAERALEDGVGHAGGARRTVLLRQPRLPLGDRLLRDLDDDRRRAEGRLGVDRLHGDGVRDQPLVGLVHSPELDRVAAL